MSSPTARAADYKREEFRKYLERAGVMDALTRAMVALYEEPNKPSDPIRYLCTLLGHSVENQPTIDALLSEIDEMKSETQRLGEENQRLRISSCSNTLSEERRENGLNECLQAMNSVQLS